jgi:hypothetical protein
MLGPARRRLTVTALGILVVCLAQSCFKKEPAREAPSSTAAPPPPVPPKAKKAEEAETRDGRAPAEPAAPGSAPLAPVAPSPSTGSALKPAAKARSRGDRQELRRSTSREEKGGTEPEKDDSESPAALMERLSEEVKAAAPDCPSARERRKAICDLASQICQLTDRDPNVASVEQYCGDARQRCGEAGRRTQERCND